MESNKICQILYENTSHTGVCNLPNISQLPYKSIGDWIIYVDDQNLDKQDQPLAMHRITKWEN